MEFELKYCQIVIILEGEKENFDYEIDEQTPPPPPPRNQPLGVVHILRNQFLEHFYPPPLRNQFYT